MSDDNQESGANAGSPAESEAGHEGSPAAREGGERISKVISRAGIASRRDVERMIGEGRIMLNGETVTTPVLLVNASDRILVDGAPLPAKEHTRLFLYHKPPGLVTTERDPEGRRTVFEALPQDLPRVVSVGRLDLNTEGLLLLTNDGGLARLLAHPKTGWLRRYRVRAFGEITQDQLDGLKDGIEIDGMRYGSIEAKVDREQGSNMWLTLGLREGKNREVKRVLEHFGLKVNRLIRISFGPFQLGELEPGAVEEVRTRTLKDQLGPELAREGKLDWGGQRQEPRRPQRGFHERVHSDDRHRAPRERGFSEKHPDKAGADELRALRQAEAVAQRRRSGAHRHSWRDAESWAVRGARKKDAPGAGHLSRPHGGGVASKPDDRRHFRGGRIADRKGRSILVERVAQDPAAAPRKAPGGGKERASETRRAGAREGVWQKRSPKAGGGFRPLAAAPRGVDVLRRKTRPEQGLAGPPRGETREGQAGKGNRIERWKRDRDPRSPREQQSGARPDWRRGNREGKERQGLRQTDEKFRSRNERDFRAKPGDGRSLGVNRPSKFRKPDAEARQRVGPGGEAGATGSRRGGDFKPRGFGAHRGRPGGLRGGPPKGSRPNRPPRKPPR